MTRFVVENYRKAFRQSEWYLSKKKDIYITSFAWRRRLIILRAWLTMEKFIVISGDRASGKVSYVHFENLCFRVSGTERHLQMNGAGRPCWGIGDGRFTDNIAFNNCEIAHGVHAVWFRQNCSRCSVHHCHLRSGGRSEDKNTIGCRQHEVTSHITVDNSIIQHGGYVFPVLSALRCSCHDNAIT